MWIRYTGYIQTNMTVTGRCGTPAPAPASPHPPLANAQETIDFSGPAKKKGNVTPS